MPAPTPEGTTFSSEDSKTDNLYTHTTGFPPGTVFGTAEPDFLIWTVVLTNTITAVPAGWTQRGMIERVPGEHFVYVFTRFTTTGMPNPAVTMTAVREGIHYSTLQTWRGVDPASPVAAILMNRNISTTSNNHTLPMVTTVADDSALVYAAGTNRNSPHSYTWTGAAESSDNYMYAPSADDVNLFSTTRWYFSITTASLTKPIPGLSPGNVVANVNGGSANSYWFGYVLALNSIPVPPPPPEPPPAHPDCASANFANGTTLAFGRPVQGVYFDQAVLGGRIGFTNPGSPGTLLYSQSVTWFNDTGLPLLITPVFVHGAKQLYVLDPSRAYVDEYWAMTSGAAPSAPIVGSTIRNRFGGGSDSSEGCVFQYLEEDLMAHTPFGQLELPNGHTIRINYECRLSNAGTAAANANASQWCQPGSHRIILVGDILPDPALP